MHNHAHHLWPFWHKGVPHETLLWNWLDTQSRLKVVAAGRDPWLQSGLGFGTAEIQCLLYILHIAEEHHTYYESICWYLPSPSQCKLLVCAARNATLSTVFTCPAHSPWPPSTLHPRRCNSGQIFLPSSRGQGSLVTQPKPHLLQVRFFDILASRRRRPCECRA